MHLVVPPFSSPPDSNPCFPDPWPCPRGCCPRQLTPRTHLCVTVTSTFLDSAECDLTGQTGQLIGRQCPWSQQRRFGSYDHVTTSQVPADAHDGSITTSPGTCSWSSLISSDYAVTGSRDQRLSSKVYLCDFFVSASCWIVSSSKMGVIAFFFILSLPPSMFLFTILFPMCDPVQGTR